MKIGVIYGCKRRKNAKTLINQKNSKTQQSAVEKTQKRCKNPEPRKLEMQNGKNVAKSKKLRNSKPPKRNNSKTQKS